MEPKTPKPRKPKKLEGEITGQVYDDATHEHFGFIGRLWKEVDLSLAEAIRLRRWLGEGIAWIQYRNRQKRAGKKRQAT